MKDKYIYDNYEIVGRRRCNEDEKDDRQYTEVCGAAEAHFWTLCGHIEGQGIELIGEFHSREAAEQVYFRITGEPFTDSFRAGRRLLLMHSADVLLAACQMVVARWEHRDLAKAVRTCDEAIKAATADCPPWLSAEPDIHALLAARQQIAEVWTVADVRMSHPGLTEDQAWEVLQYCKRFYDPALGLTWEVIRAAIATLYPERCNSGGSK